MPKCKECVNYREIDETKGDFFGHEVDTDMDSSECPTNAFQSREE